MPQSLKIISACLLGVRCAWDGEDKYKNDRAMRLAKRGVLIPVCPEQLGGLRTPRNKQEIRGGTGDDVLDGRSRVLTEKREDVTEEFVRGAAETLKIAQQFKIKEFIAKSKSPSCGCGQIYDGSFSGKLINGDGVTTAFLKRNGIKVIREENL